MVAAVLLAAPADRAAGQAATTDPEPTAASDFWGDLLEALDPEGEAAIGWIDDSWPAVEDWGRVVPDEWIGTDDFVSPDEGTEYDPNVWFSGDYAPVEGGEVTPAESADPTAPSGSDSEWTIHEAVSTHLGNSIEYK